jgi:hypothetical protein
MADKHGQLTFYGICKSLKGEPVKECTLEWLETGDNEGDLELTGHIEKFHVKITGQMLADMTVRITKAAEEISEAYTQFQEGSPLISEKLTSRYYTLSEMKSEIEKEMLEIKGSIQDEMESKNIDSLSEDFGSFYFTSRKKYSYPEEIKTLEKEYKEAKKAYEKTNEPESISKSFSFRAK